MFFTSNINNPNEITVLVNKENNLQENYIPDDLEMISLKYAHKDKYLRKEAKEAFEKLSEDASKLGYIILAVSTYRSYEYQKKLYETYTEEKGIEYAANCCAKAGYSEHQTGLAVDVEGSNTDYNKFEESLEFDWMKNNSYKYGFILRYPKDKQNITKYKYEPWHYRYVGIDLAKYLYENNLVLEEKK